MKSIIQCIVLLFLFCSAMAQESSAKTEYQNALAQYQNQIDLQIKQRMELIKNITQINTDVKKLQDKRQKLLSQFEANLKTKNNIRNELNRFQNELQALQNKVHIAITDHNYNRKNSALGAANRIESIKFKSFKAFFETLTNEELETSKVGRFKADIIGQNDQVSSEDIVLVGNLAAYSSGTNPALLQLKKDTFSKTRNLVLSQTEQNNLKKDFITGLPFDVTGGEALSIQQEAPSITQRIENGGIIVYPILAIGLIAIFIIAIKLFTLLGMGGKTLVLENQILETAKNGHWNILAEHLKKKKNLPSQIVFEVIEKNLQSKEEKEAFLEERIYGHIPHLENMLPTLNILGVISPLLGLLGTVSGMIATFDIIALHGSGDPGLLSKGISEALITTQLGLMVAVPIVLIHSLLSSKVENLINDMQLISNSLISSMHPIEHEDKSNV